MASRQEKHFKNYEFKQVPRASGKGYKNVYKYIGDYYTWDIPTQGLRRERQCFVLLEVISLILYFGAAVQNAEQNRLAIVAVPSICSLAAWVFELIAIGFFSFVKLPLKEEDYKRVDSTFFLTFPLRALFLTVATVGCIIYTIRNSAGMQSWLLSLVYAVCAVLALVLMIRYQKLKARKKVILAE
ncbi:MAG: hypothetical protein LUG99_16385 [Lachnospiraceae bacterium]|nr:hypothetical protein [Lachnospiraceae bacterium]